MKVSVVIPAYNEEKRLASCLKSVFNQTVAPYEVVVVDNNSTDRTAEIAEKMGARVVKENIQGLIFARNRGFDEAKGDIIARTDADTTVPNTWIEKISKHFTEEPIDALSGPAIFGIRILSPVLRILVFEANKRIFGHHSLYGPNYALRREMWEKVRGEVCLEDSRVHEDTDMSIHIGKKGTIGFDSDLKVRTSARRLRSNPSSQLVDYLIKWVDTIASHKKYRILRAVSKVKEVANGEYDNNG